ncbi:hypothetical protein [Myxococcus sp. CA040A]|uniref:hypothetical protein n=1 Tax=Myxococcus sp. CA040A TaxID=2741738 RepID=UPI00157B41A7|nr:hypothetical protein [Myxococcus sp. CA040A]NTX07257.1 hypothetical protein [Myxococcus sp. CA040A]
MQASLKLHPTRFSSASPRSLLLAGTVLGLLTVPSVAHALLLITCPAGTTQMTYSPGLTYTSKLIQYMGSELSGVCTGVGLPAGVSSFTTTFTGETTASCVTLLATDEGDQTFVWNNGAISTWHFTTIVGTSVSGQRVLTLKGPITAGLFQGAQVTQVATFLNLDLAACSTEAGLTSASGPSTYLFTAL